MDLGNGGPWMQAWSVEEREREREMTTWWSWPSVAAAHNCLHNIIPWFDVIKTTVCHCDWPGLLLHHGAVVAKPLYHIVVLYHMQMAYDRAPLCGTVVLQQLLYDKVEVVDHFGEVRCDDGKHTRDAWFIRRVGSSVHCT